VRQLTHKLKHKMKKEIRYMCVVITNMKVICSLYKLAHASKYLQCNKFFVIGKSMVHLMLCNFLHVMNDFFKN
jgi:hypothetical protein